MESCPYLAFEDTLGPRQNRPLPRDLLRRYTISSVKTLMGGCLVMGLINTEQIKKQQYRFHSLGAVFSECLLGTSIWTSNTDDN